MNISLGYPEFLLLSSAAIYLGGGEIFSYILASASVVSALFRVGLKIQKAEQEKKDAEDLVGKFKDSLYKVAVMSSNPNDSTQH